MRRLLLATLFPLGLSACMGVDYTLAPTITAACTVSDLMLPAGGSGIVGYQAADLQRVVYATGQDFSDLEDKLHVQQAGTLDHPCITLSITPLNRSPHTAQDQGPAPAPMAMVAMPPVLGPKFAVHFAFNSTQIDRNAAETIAAAAQQLSTSDARIEVIGHTDTTGALGYNQTLSEQRAQAVARELVRDGVHAGLVSTTGVGKQDLLIETGNGVRSRANRRAVITSS